MIGSRVSWAAVPALTCFAFWAAGAASAPAEQSATKTLAGVTATVRWTTAQRMVPRGDEAARIVIRSGSIEIGGAGVERSRLPLAEFISAKRLIVMVTDPRDGCGAVETLALIPAGVSGPPYVVAFAAEVGKGCRPLSTVFVPVPVSSTRWRYVNARQYTLEYPAPPNPSAEPPFVAATKFVVRSAQRVKLPTAAGMPSWTKTVCYGEGAGPGAITLEEYLLTPAQRPTTVGKRDALMLSLDGRARLMKRP